MKVIGDEALNMMNILRKLSRGGLICLSPPLRDFVFQSFGALDYISKIIHNVTQNVSVRSVAEEVLSNLQNDCINFTCIQQKQWSSLLFA